MSLLASIKSVLSIEGSPSSTISGRTEFVLLRPAFNS